jgi:DNA-binding CsgD family transcriptional regulator
VRDEIAATGAAPRVTDFQGMAALTPSEKRVAGLAVEGMTNREIAQSLFVTPKTIEVHLSNVYRKLDVKSRRELPGVFVPEPA